MCFLMVRFVDVISPMCPSVERILISSGEKSIVLMRGLLLVIQQSRGIVIVIRFAFFLKSQKYIVGYFSSGNAMIADSGTKIGFLHVSYMVLSSFLTGVVELFFEL